MTKVLTLFLILVIGFLFYPFRDLYVRTDTFGGDNQLVDRGLWSLEACMIAAAGYRSRDYQCRKRTGLMRILGTYGQYAQSVDNLSEQLP